MIFFKKLDVCEFFIEIEKYYGEYPENKRAIVFGFAVKLDDYERAALYNELIESYPSGFTPPDVYRLNLHFKKAKKRLENERILRSFEEKEEEAGNLAAALPEMAEQYGLNPSDEHLFTKILLCKIKEKQKGGKSKE